MRKTLVLPALAALALAGPAMAGTFSYSYLEGGLSGEGADDPNGDIGGNYDRKGSGLTLHGNWAIGHVMYGFADLNGTNYEYHHLGTDEEDFSAAKLGLGLGFHIPLGRKLDLVTGLSLQRLRLENDFDNTSFNEQGYGFDAGLRGLIGERLQWTVGMQYVDYGDDFDDTSWSTGFRYYFTRQFAMGVDVGSTDKDQGNILIAFRWDVGNR